MERNIVSVRDEKNLKLDYFPYLLSVTKTIFILCLFLLPFAEWRIVYLPLHGRTFGIDFTGYRSASFFDLAFFLFMILSLPFIWQFIRKKKFVNYYLLFWFPAVILIPLLYIYLQPTLPFLTPSQKNVIGVRGFIVHFAVTVGVTIFLTRVHVKKIIMASYWYYVIMMGCFVILSILAFAEFRYFYEHYPFATPFTISFPFPNQNIAAPFITICLLGLMGAATACHKSFIIILAMPIGVLAAVLTGSRSNMLLLTITVVVYWIVYGVLYVLKDPRSIKGKYLVVGGLAITTAVGLLALNYNWQPVRRALSIFEKIGKDPLSIFWGGPDSPRREMWEAALSGEKIENARREEKYKVYLLSIDNGQVRKSGEINKLDIDERYYIRLTVKKEEDGFRYGVLEVFTDKERLKLRGRSKLKIGTSVPRSFFLFVSDTGTARGWATISASLDNYKIIRLKGSTQFTFSEDEGLKWYEEWYKERYGDSKGVIRSNEQQLRLVADEQIVRGYVEKADILDKGDANYVLEYEVTIDHLEPIQPVTGPARFYVGFHDGESGDGARQWEVVRDALLVGHERVMTAQEYGVLRANKLANLSKYVGEERVTNSLGETTRLIKSKSFKMGDEGKVRIEKLWESEITADDIKQAKNYKLGAKVDDNTVIFAPDESWSAKSHMAHKGSTHNVYVDWYYYVGKLPSAIFVLFILILIITFAIFLYKQHESPYFAYYLAVWLQLVVLTGAMYAHPGIWIKYIWFTFGVAGALMLLEGHSGSPEKST
jgi:hypothetical protein